MEGSIKVTHLSEDYATINGKSYISQNRLLIVRSALENELNKTCAELERLTKENEAFRVLLGKKLMEEKKND